MKKVICNKRTSELAMKQMLLAFKECYLTLQYALLTFFNLASGTEEKKKWKKLIEEVGENYKIAMEKGQKQEN